MGVDILEEVGAPQQPVLPGVVGRSRLGLQHSNAITVAGDAVSMLSTCGPVCAGVACASVWVTAPQHRSYEQSVPAVPARMSAKYRISASAVLHAQRRLGRRGAEAALSALFWACRRFDHIFGMFRTAAGAVRRLDVIFATHDERAFCILGCAPNTLKP